MAKNYLIYLSIITLTASAIYLSSAAEITGYRERFIDFLEKSSDKTGKAEAEPDKSVFIKGADEDPSGYSEGDWYEYTSDKYNYNYLQDPDRGNIYSGDTISIDSYGTATFNFKYGNVRFTDDKYKQYDKDNPESRVIEQGFMPEQVVQLHVEGKAGDRVTVYLDHDSKRDDNRYITQYRALSDDELVREVNAGEIDIKFNQSKFAVYDNTDAKGLGIDFTLGRDNYLFKAFGSVVRGEAAVDYFKGNSSQGNIKLSEYQYIRKTYYQLEPFSRYDNVQVKPSGSTVYTYAALTSAPSNPSSYKPYSVNISTDGFALYMDDQNQYNNYNAIKLSLDGGYYSRLINGTDYTINYTTGVIKFVKDIPEDARIFAVYKRSGGTVDPCAIPPGDLNHPGGDFTGKIFVFIKYGYSTNEDTVSKNMSFDSGETDKNGDGRVNLDIYEIRSFYFLGAKNLISGNLSLGFWKENSVITDSEKQDLSAYSIDYSGGIISFNLREPYRPLLGSAAAGYIYSESKLTNSYSYSRYSIKADYAIEARSFQLSNTNLIEKSVRVKINERDIPGSLYSVDYESGYLAFSDPNNPVIGSDTLIEVKYEYLPFGNANGSFIGGVRGDYNISKDLRVGGSVLLSRNSEGEVIPDVGEESESTLLFEGDATLKLTEKRLTEFFRTITGGSRRTIPAEITFYAEHAKSIKDINTFGKALIDNMEKSDDTLSVSLSEKDWILSSMPSGYSESERGILNYYFYRNPDSPDSLKGSGYNATKVDYSVKPGPFNIATGHVDDDITSVKSQRSLVFDFDFTSSSCFSVVTRELNEESTDLSGIQYIEVWVKYEGNAGDLVGLYMDIGSINEDSDSDGVLDTEDANSNGHIDSEPSKGYSEDRGYAFNGNNATKVGAGPGLSSSTKGDGILNSEDLNGNGVLDQIEQVYTVRIGNISAEGGWRKIRIYIDSEAISSSQKDILKQTESIRLYAVKNTGITGRLFIDSIKLVASKWKDTELDGITVGDPSVVKLTMVDSINDSEYRRDSLLVREKNLFESLYGSDSTDEVDSCLETALQVDYNIPAGKNELIITRRFTKEMDLRFYKTLNAWINARTISPSNTITFILGSSDNDYIEFRTVPSDTSKWEEMTFKLKKSSSGDTEIYSETGSPDMRRIKYIKLKIAGSGTSGRIWFNDIYVSEPVKQEGDARWYECNLKILKPLAKTDSGTPVMSDIDLKYIYKWISSNFSSLNRTEKDISERYNEFYSSAKVLPNWDANADYINEYSVSDSLDENLSIDRRGRVTRNYLLLNSVFNSTGGSVPSVSCSYSFDNTSGEKDLEVSATDYEEKTDKTVHAPLISWIQEFDNGVLGKIITRIKMNMLFTEERAKRDSDSVSKSVLSGYIPLNETEKKQKADATLGVEYVNGGFFLKPSVDMSSSEAVGWEGESNSLGISDELNESYHVPFYRADDMKYLERSNGFSFTTGYSIFDFLIPEYSIGYGYKENGFEDFYTIDDDIGFARSKDCISSFNTGIKIPVNLKRIEWLESVKHFQVNYTRGMTLSETDVPYEGEKTDYFSEEYGVSRVFTGVSPDAYNLFRNYPGINFKGRGNYAKGRDLLYSSMNEKLDVMKENSSVEYDNGLNLDEKFSADMSININIADITVSGALGQICDRGNLYGIPNQVVTWQTGFNIDFDLMKIFSFGFFRANDAGLPYHASTLSTGLEFTDSMLITENINEKKVTPNLGLTFKIDRTSFGIKGSVDFRNKTLKEYIDFDTEEDEPDYIYISNMEGNEDFMEDDRGYKFSAFYETDVKWIYDYFALFYKLNGLPVFAIEYSMEIDRYDYTKTVSPEPYDLHMLKGDLTMDLHQNVRGGITGRMALEKFRNLENNGISREVASYEVSGTFSLIF